MALLVPKSAIDSKSVHLDVFLFKNTVTIGQSSDIFCDSVRVSFSTVPLPQLGLA